MALYHLEQELQTVVNHHVDIGNITYPLKEPPVLLITETYLQPTGMLLKRLILLISTGKLGEFSLLFPFHFQF